MRRRLALLVAATTTVVLLAFLLPLAVLVSRAARSDAVSDATTRSQVVVSAVASGASPAEVRPLIAELEEAGLATRIRRAERSSDRTTVSPAADGGLLLRQPVLLGDRIRVVQTTIPRSRLTEGVVRAWVVLGMLGLALVAVSLVVADRLAFTLTRPISQLAAVARRLAHGDLDARVRPDGPPEVREVGEALNLLAGRIGELLTRERESVADLSHRLRTPVTALRLGVENLPAGAERAVLVGAVDELDRQVGALIREARRPVREGVEARCDAASVVAERVTFWAPLAEDQQRVVSASIPQGPIWVRCSAADLEAALDALLENVVAHTPEGTGFAVSVTAAPGGGAAVAVTDDGPGFADSAVVERGESRGGSTGLGLDIVRRTAAAAGGSMHVGASRTGGALVSLHLGPAGTSNAAG